MYYYKIINYGEPFQPKPETDPDCCHDAQGAKVIWSHFQLRHCKKLPTLPGHL
jgi:hypothetical protein